LKKKKKMPSAAEVVRPSGGKERRRKILYINFEGEAVLPPEKKPKRGNEGGYGPFPEEKEGRKSVSRFPLRGGEGSSTREEKRLVISVRTREKKDAGQAYPQKKRGAPSRCERDKEKKKDRT